MATFIGSFMMNFWAFLFFRALVGIGEASYSTIAPAIISDLFTKDTRSRVLALFYFAIPVGTGLGYIIGKCFMIFVHDFKFVNYSHVVENLQKRRFCIVTGEFPK